MGPAVQTSGYVVSTIVRNDANLRHSGDLWLEAESSR